jgi:DNA recombination protein RmuC
VRSNKLAGASASREHSAGKARTFIGPGCNLNVRSVRGARHARRVLIAIGLILGALLGGGGALLAVRGRLRALSAEAERAVGLDRELVRAQADLEHERTLSQERLATLQDAQQRLSDSFKALSAEALQASMAQLTEMARTQLRAAQAEAKGDLDKRHAAVEQLVAPLKDQLGRVDQQLIALDRERRESRGRLDAQLRTLTETGEKLRTETGALVTALRKPNTRGQWGQMQLRKVVELAGMVRHCDFVEQASFVADETAMRPDLVVNLPGGKHVVVDAKAPLQAVLDAYEARDEDERMRHLQVHARLLRKHVKQLADKAYWTGLDSAPDFVVMFLPGEHLYGAALEADPELIEDAMARRVLIATPTTLLAMLRAVGYGWQQERVAESAQAISELGRDLHARLVKLSTLLATLGSRLNSTVRAYNETVGSYEARVIPGARRFAEHGAVGEGSELPRLEQVTVSARTVRVADEVAEVGPKPLEPLTGFDELRALRLG